MMGIRVVQRTVSLPINILISLIAFIGALCVGGILLAAVGVSPIDAYSSMLKESFGTFNGFTETLVKATPLIITGLGLTVAFRMKLWNIGAEGQIAMGAFGATFVALYSGVANHAVMLIGMFIAATICGGLWGAISGYLKAKLDVNEVITSLLLNYVALSIVDYFVYGPWKDPNGMNFPFTAYFADTARLTNLFGTRLHTGLILGVVLAIIVYILLDKTTWGYKLRVVGNNPKAADYAGISSRNQIVVVMLVSGALAGIAGFSEVAGLQHRLQSNISAGYGYTAIIVAWLGKRNPFGVVLVGLIMGILLVGGEGLQLFHSLSPYMINVYLGLILFSLVISDFFSTHKIEFVGKGGK